MIRYNRNGLIPGEPEGKSYFEIHSSKISIKVEPKNKVKNFFERLFHL